MTADDQRVTLERIDYESSFHFTRLFDCFRLAVHPSRLLLALLLIVLLYIGGRVMDTMWGPRAYPGEFQAYLEEPTADPQTLRDRVGAADGGEPEGVFHAALDLNLALFDAMVAAALELNLGLDQLTPGAEPSGGSVVGALRMMIMAPAWLWHMHRGFLIVFLILFVLLWSLLGGTISRQAMVDAASGRILPASEAFGFVWKRWGWYLLAPLMPLLIIGAFALLLAVAGLVLFNVPVLNILGGLLFIAALAAGFVMALLLIGWLGGVHLMYPALSAEGTDAFDAMSRAFSYVLDRPWRLILYSLIGLVYGAATYLFVGLVVFLIICVTQWAVGAWVFTEAAEGVNRFEAMLPRPEFGRMSEMPELAGLPWHDKIAATLVRVWVYLLVGLVAAYVISFYLSVYSVIYLLLRRYTDGTDQAEVFEPEPTTPPAQEKVEPTDEGA